MKWLILFAVSVVFLVSSFVLAFVKSKAKYKSGRILDSTKILLGGLVLSSLTLFIPIYSNIFENSDCGILETILISIHNMIRLFIVDGEFEFILSNIKSIPDWLARGYTVMFSVLFVLAPLMTFGFVLSFFKNVSAYIKLITHFNLDVFIFSELNEGSIALAQDLYKNNPKKRLFVFTDVFESEEEKCYELVERSKEIGAIRFKKDIVTINFAFHNKGKDLNFFVIGEDQSENISQAIKLIEKFKYRENTNLYVFSNQNESEFLLDKVFNDFDYREDIEKSIKIRVRRINEVQSLITRTLYENGYDKIFKSAFDDGSGVRKINAVVVGMGQYGTEMTKALSWFCQMTGYLVEINAFDVDSLASERFKSICPELMKFSGVLDIAGEAKYTINIHSGININTSTFDDMILSLPRTTYVFVAIGNDEENILTSIKLRTLYERVGYCPEIQAVVYNSEKKEALVDVSNFKGQKYNIDYIGDIKSSYSEKVVLASEIEQKALKRHMVWGEERTFWQYNYNYKSSMASAIHRKMKTLCGVPGADKEPTERTEDELWLLRILEHCRWNAYMRSEGYVYGGTIEKTGRNDLAKTHNCLVPFEDLPVSEQEKDDF